MLKFKIFNWMLKVAGLRVQNQKSNIENWKSQKLKIES